MTYLGVFSEKNHGNLCGKIISIIYGIYGKIELNNHIPWEKIMVLLTGIFFFELWYTILNNIMDISYGIEINIDIMEYSCHCHAKTNALGYQRLGGLEAQRTDGGFQVLTGNVSVRNAPNKNLTERVEKRYDL